MAIFPIKKQRICIQNILSGIKPPAMQTTPQIKSEDTREIFLPNLFIIT
jgi:hypothetical protein